jgi:hypothetical protein
MIFEMRVQFLPASNRMSSNSNDNNNNNKKWKRGKNFKLDKSLFDTLGPLHGPVQHRAGLSPSRGNSGAPSVNILRRPNRKPFFAPDMPSALEKTYASMAPGTYRNWIKRQIERERNARAAARTNALRRASKKQNHVPSMKENNRTLRNQLLKMAIDAKSAVAHPSPARTMRTIKLANGSNRPPARNTNKNTTRREYSLNNLRAHPSGRLNFKKTLAMLGLNKNRNSTRECLN